MMECLKLSIILTILISNVIGIPPPTSFSSTNFVVASTEPTNNEAIQGEAQKPSAPPELNSMHVECNITNRYAHTVISSRYKNPADIAQEATFSINLPETAFISGFTMEIKGKVYEAYVKEKEEAKKDYEHAVQSGFGAAHIEQSARDSNKFKVSVNVEPRSKVIFNLSYEELLVRKHGKYEMIMNLQPGQLVKDLTVDVLINETKPLINVIAPALRSGNEIYEENINKTNEYAQITKIGDDGKCVKIHFAPTVQQQKEMTKSLEALAEKKRQNNNPYFEDPSFYQEQNQQNKKEDTLSGQFVVEYDVDRNSKGGDVLVNDGYFVHFFAPSDLKPIPKHAVFVLDVSGSMAGRKIEQVKQAMQVILDELNPEDYFNLIEFSFGAKAWNLDNPNASTTYDKSRNPWWRATEEENEPEIPFELPPAFPATEDYKQRAKNIIQNMEAFGGTNIYDALNVALNLTSQGVPENKERKREPEPIIVFLTDGEATDGPTDSKVILNTVDELNNEENKAAIFSLSFGFDANKDLLKKLSLRNLGFMRQIYEASDASLQLQDFYKQISSPLLSNVTFTYPEGEVESVTKHNFHTLFDGGEFVVAGKMENPKDKILYVHGFTYEGPIDFPPSIIPIPNPEEVKQPTGPLERLWAYLTIKQLLDKKDEISAVDNNSTEAEDLESKALKLALKYSFVTPVTSLVVVKPNETEKVNAEEANPPGFDGQAGAFLSAPAGGFGGGFYAPSASAGGAFAGASFAPPSRFAAASFSPDSGFGGGSFGSAGGFGGGGYAGPPMSDLGIGAGQGIGGSIGGNVNDFGPPSTPFTGMSFPTYYPPSSPRDLSPAYVSGPYQPASIGPYQPAIPADVDVPGLPWVSSLAFNQFLITINNTMYNVGNNETIINETPCEVDNIKGNCTLLPICTKMHSVLVSYETYFPKYFCNLELGYAGVCCLGNDEEKQS